MYVLVRREFNTPFVKEVRGGYGIEGQAVDAVRALNPPPGTRWKHDSSGNPAWGDSWGCLPEPRYREMLAEGLLRLPAAPGVAGDAA